ncbi:MAG: gliding motility lipoprotein GldH [Chitinophagaceae bacterium]|nr:gliding motility lipoprotein GldH [Chitinophagaceae bacterium]
MFKTAFITFMAGSMLLVSCAKINVYEKNAAISNLSWEGSFKPSFTFNIQDTSSYYNIFLIIRHTDAYNYNNIWLNVFTKAPGDKAQKQQLPVQLANNKKGWLGTGMDDIFEHRILITREPVQLRKAGDYTFTLQQIMREDPLQHVLNVGVRVERVN